MRFEKVAFRYTPEQPVLTNVSFAAAAGETVAIVGESGAGKSTLVRLLLRFEDPEHGRILLDGQDVRDVTLHSLRSQIAVVLQNPFLLPISVAANIAYGHPGASEDDIRTAARAACAHEFIERLPEGYDTILGEHTSLSGGEQQRLAIARAILANAPIVILDEPTASLDAETEESLMLALDHLCEGRTVLMIAHRQATIRRADRVITIRGGQLLDEVLA